MAKCDATLNDVPDEVRGFPTIKMYPAGKKDSPVEYTGDRSVESLAQFIKEKGTYGIEVAVVDQVQVQEPGQTEGDKAKVEDSDQVADPGIHDEL